MRRVSILTVAAGAAALCGCQVSTDDGAPSSNGASTAGSVPAGPAAAGGSVFVHTFPEAGYPTPDTTLRGRFAVDRGCLTFVAGGASFRAVLPSGTRFRAPDSVLLPGGRQVALGSEIVVKGGEGEFGAASSVPADCPRNAVLIGDLE